MGNNRMTTIAVASILIGVWLVSLHSLPASAGEKDTTIRIACTAGPRCNHPNQEFKLCEKLVNQAIEDGRKPPMVIPFYGNANLYHQAIEDGRKPPMKVIPFYGNANQVYELYMQQMRHDSKVLHDNSSDTSAAGNDQVLDCPPANKGVEQSHGRGTKLDPQETIDVYQLDMISVGGLSDYLLTLYPCRIDESPLDTASQCYVTPDTVDEHFQSIIDYSMVNGRLKAVPWFVDIGVLYFKKDLLNMYEHIIIHELRRLRRTPAVRPVVPADWTELVKIANTVQKEYKTRPNNIATQGQKEDVLGFIWPGDAYEGLTCNVLEWIYSYGGKPVVFDNRTNTIAIMFNGDGVELAIESARAWIWSNHISPAGLQKVNDDDLSSERLNNVLNRIFAPDVLFMRNWSTKWKELKNDGYGVMLMPGGKGHESAHPATLGGQQLAVAKFSQHQSDAVKLILYLTRLDVQEQRAKEGGFLPSLKKAYSQQGIKDTDLQAWTIA